jgi:hypothetical protein
MDLRRAISVDWWRFEQGKGGGTGEGKEGNKRGVVAGAVSISGGAGKREIVPGGFWCGRGGNGWG